MPDPMQTLMEQQDQLQTNHQTILKSQDYLAKVTSALAPLVKLGYNVTQDDVLKASMPLVENGTLTSKMLAVELSTMPLQGPALFDWIKTQMEKHQQQMQQMAQAKAQTVHNLGMNSMHLLAQLGGR